MSSYYTASSNERYLLRISPLSVLLKKWKGALDTVSLSSLRVAGPTA